MLIVLGAFLCAAVFPFPQRASSSNAALVIPDIGGNYAGTTADMISNCDGITHPQGGTAAIDVTVDQDGENFTATMATQDRSGGMIELVGTIDSGAMMTGRYSFNYAGYTGSGTFTGEATGASLSFDLTGTLSGNGITCSQTRQIQVAQTLPSGTVADLSITGVASPDPVATGTQIHYTLTVANAGPNDAPNTIVMAPLPDGTTFASAAASQGALDSPAVGSSGNVTCRLGTLAKGSTAMVTLTANVLAASGSILETRASVHSDSVGDPTMSNNTADIVTAVHGGGVVKLVWDEPPPTASNPTPAPVNLRILPGDEAPKTTPGAVALRIRPETGTGCALIAINIYKSDHPSVQAIPANLWKVVPPDMLQAAMAVAPGGSFFVITNLWNCGGQTVESGVSNEQGVPAGPAITSLRLTGKLKASGTGFSDTVEVFIGGTGFLKAAVVPDGTLVIQKGPLTSGLSIGDIVTENKQVLITVKNSDGGIGSFNYQPR
jgi:uncharacterized repeat protein (TIGR01451 family)